MKSAQGNVSKRESFSEQSNKDKVKIKITNSVGNKDVQLGRSRSTSIIGRFAKENFNDKLRLSLNKNGAKQMEIEKPNSLQELFKIDRPYKAKPKSEKAAKSSRKAAKS
ncbi:hypothetical protein niasHT_032317 [Heterodera trifolii]|uniref:Uncharacterized protein n=1 Tax=Heterodera trifolii TaxID=157864 RepID=A0ABD2HVA7_9BILA